MTTGTEDTAKIKMAKRSDYITILLIEKRATDKDRRPTTS